MTRSPQLLVAGGGKGVARLGPLAGLCSVFLLVAVPPAGRAENWPSFRGELAAGVATLPGPTVFDGEAGSNLRWKTAIPGLANAAPIVWGDRVYVATAASDEKDPVYRAGLYGDVDSVASLPPTRWLLLAIDRSSGQVVWERQAAAGVPKVKRHLKSTHANSTPVTNGSHIVVLFGSEGLFCYDRDGKLLWHRELGVLDAGWFYDPAYQWEYGSSPVIHQDRVIVQADIQKGSFLAAFSLADGRELWRTPREEIPSWSTPTVVPAGAGFEIVTNATKAIRGYDPADGKELWRLTPNSEIVAPTPIFAHGLTFVTAGYAPVRPIYAIRPGQRGDLTLPTGATSSAAIAWSVPRGGPYMPTPIVVGEVLYALANNGMLSAYEATTGKDLFRERVASSGVSFTASPVAAGGMLYLSSEEGDVFVVRAGKTFELVGKNPVGEVLMATPAVADGTLYVRGRSHLFAFAAPPPSTPSTAPAGAAPPPAPGTTSKP